MPTLSEEIIAAKDALKQDQKIQHALVHGPAGSGTVGGITVTDGFVTTENGPAPTSAKAFELVSTGLVRRSTSVRTPASGIVSFALTGTNTIFPWDTHTRIQVVSESDPYSYFQGFVVEATSTTIEINADVWGGTEHNDWIIAISGKNGSEGWSPVLGVVEYSLAVVAEAPLNLSFVGGTEVNTAADLNEYGIFEGMEVVGDGVELGTTIGSFTDGNTIATLSQSISEPVTGTVAFVGSGGLRRALKVMSWQGGTGTAPTAGLYLGTSGLVEDIRDAVNVRGSTGASGSNGNDGSDGVNAVVTRSSSSSVAVGTGSKTFYFTETPNLGWMVGSRLRTVRSSDVTIFMEGAVTAVSTTSMTLSADTSSGSGTFNDWNIVIAGGGTVQPIALGGTGQTTAALAFAGLKQAATTTSSGVVELGTLAETKNGDAGVVPTSADMLLALLSAQVRRSFSPSTGGWQKITTGGATGAINDYGMELQAPSSIQTPGYVLFYNRPHNICGVSRGKGKGVIDWSKKVGIGATICISASFDTVNVFRMTLGKIATTDLAGPLPSGRRGIGVQIASNGKVEAHTGSGTGGPTTTTTSLATALLGVSIDVWIESFNGVLKVFVNDVEVASTSGAPTTDGGSTENGFVMEFDTPSTPTNTGQITVSNYAQFIGR